MSDRWRCAHSSSPAGPGLSGPRSHGGADAHGPAGIASFSIDRAPANGAGSVVIPLGEGHNDVPELGTGAVRNAFEFAAGAVTRDNFGFIGFDGVRVVTSLAQAGGAPQDARANIDVMIGDGVAGGSCRATLSGWRTPAT